MTILINCTDKFCYGHGNFQNAKAATRGAFKSFIKLAGKHLCQNLFFNIFAGLRLAILLKRDSDMYFPVNFVKLLRTPFASVSQNIKVYIWQRPCTVVWWKVFLEIFGKYPGAYLHWIASYKFRKAKDWSNLQNNQIRYHKTSKINLGLYFSKAFLSCLICRGGGYF